MESKRFFVGNLPPGTTESDLNDLFYHYGQIERVEVKTKENIVDPENPKVLAFVTLQIGGGQVDRCISDLTNQRFQGQYLNVSVAKESFLERLKRERKDDGKEAEKPEEFNESYSKPINIPLPRNLDVPIANKSIKFDFGDGDEVPDLDNDAQVIYQSITKKKASNSMLNGKIKIESVATDPIHVISQKQKPLKRLDEKSQKADQKRKESQNKMKNQYTNQKLAIQQALSGVDGGTKSNKIVFDHEVDPDYFGNSKKVSLFDGDEDEDDDDETNFEIRQQFEGEEGARLMKIQSKLSLDPRFKMSSKFLEGEEPAKDAVAEEEEENFDERRWQMDIIERVVGKKLESDFPQKKKSQNGMLRYDPTREDHQKYVVTEPVEDVEKKTKDKNASKVEKVEPEVSKEVFYTVSDDLTKSLKRRGDGFSLLSMFGRAEEESDAEDKPEYAEKILINKGDKRGGPGNPFKFDSESESDNEGKAEQPEKKPVAKKGGKTKTGVWTENFFFVHNDTRLKEGLAFYKAATKEKTDEPAESYDKIKDKLRIIIKQKINKTKRNMNKTSNKFKNRDVKKLKRKV